MISGNGTLQAALANVAPPHWNVLLVCTGTPQPASVLLLRWKPAAKCKNVYKLVKLYTD